MVINLKALVNLSLNLYQALLEKSVIAFVFEKCNTKRSDLSAPFSDLDQGCPDTKSPSLSFCFSNLRNNKCTMVDRWLTPLLHLCISLVSLYCFHTALQLIAAIQPLLWIGTS